jgi:hypothetical protein
MTLNFPASPDNGDTYDNFIYDATKGAWKLVTIAGNDLTDLNDVAITTPAEGQAILYDASSGDWINQNIDIPAGTTISATAPGSPEAGELWWDSDNGNLYIYYDDGTSSQWVSASDGQVTISDTAPTGYNGQLWWKSDEGKLYVYYDDGDSSAWVAAGGPQVTVQATAPTGYQGQLWLDSTDGSMYVYYTDPGGANSQWIGAVSRSGGILQVVSTTKTDTFTTTSSSYVDVTGLSATITPRSTSSKILVVSSVSLGVMTSTTGEGGGARLVRDSTPLAIGDVVGSRYQASASNGIATVGQFDNLLINHSVTFLDSPSTTSTVTYKIQVVNPSADTTTVNRTGVDGNTANTPRTASSITLIEVAG